MRHCCERMTRQVERTCDQHPDPFDCPRILLCYMARFDEYGIMEHGETNAGVSVRIEFCPFCGAKLPESKRDLWFERLEAMGVDPWEADSVPPAFQTDEWYR